MAKALAGTDGKNQNVVSEDEDVLSYEEIKAIAEGKEFVSGSNEMNQPIVSEHDDEKAGSLSETMQAQDTEKHNRHSGR